MSSPPIPAATLVLFRVEDGITQHLFVERSGTMSFAAGAIVFPGGRIDAGDEALAAHYPEVPDAAARVAAIRETIEEAGVAVGLRPPPDLETVERLRAHLTEGMVFGDCLAAARLTLDLSDLTLFARWCPRFHQTRNFDTRFYLADMPAGAPVARVDATENVRVFWASARSVLDQAEAGALQLIFPTRRNLERLAMLASYDAAVAQAATVAADLITPWIENRADGPYICIPEGRGYPVTAEPLPAARRS